MDNVVADDVELNEEKEIEVEKVKVEAFKGDPNLDRRDSFYGDFYTGKKKKSKKGSKKRSGNRRRKGQQASSSSEGGKPQGPKKKRNRRRRRPNKNQSQSKE
jgi:hypothetical protein